MTLEELKMAADEMGYMLVRKDEYGKLLPCLCGNQHIIRVQTLSNGSRTWRYSCPKCGFNSKRESSDSEARVLWNRAVTENVLFGKESED